MMANGRARAKNTNTPTNGTFCMITSFVVCNHELLLDPLIEYKKNTADSIGGISHFRVGC
jgi:hypothetical protein